MFVAGDGTATRDAIANGERDVAPVSEYDAFTFEKEGKPVGVDWVEDGTVMLPAPLGLVKGSPNSENALALAQYLLSREGQELYQRHHPVLVGPPRRQGAGRQAGARF